MLAKTDPAFFSSGLVAVVGLGAFVVTAFFFSIAL
jgi:hypothetical protein